MSTIPGSTSLPRASIASRASPRSWPTAEMRPFATATSALRGAAPLPSTRVPPRITRSCIRRLLEVDFDLGAPHADPIGLRGPADRVALRAAVAHVDPPSVHGALEDA